MASRNQNRPPRSPYGKKDGAEDAPVDKRRRVGAGRMAPVDTGRGRRALAVTNKQDVVVANSGVESVEGSECSVVEFTKEEVEALLNEKLKGKKFDVKGNMERMGEQIKKLKLCIKWFQQVDESHRLEQEKLKNELELAAKNCLDTEMKMRIKEEELNALITDLRKQNDCLQEKVAKEESDKLDAIDRHRREQEGRAAAEKLQAALSEELAKTQEEKNAANLKAAALSDTYKNLQEYNTSLHQYNSKLQTDLASANDSLKRVEKEKLAIVENLSTLRGHCSSLQEQLTSSRASQDEAIKQKDSLATEIQCLRGEIQQLRDDRDHHVNQVHTLTADILKYKEATGKSFTELDSLTIKSNALEETCSSQMEQIRVLKIQLAAANEKLKMTDLSSMEIRTEFEKQNTCIVELKNHLADLERQLAEGEIIRKKLHNTILELKGNIRVFCRVRPFLSEEGVGVESSAISYPTSTESLGRGIDVIQSGAKHAFTFDKVFANEASQKDVFEEISQLVQSALDGYKVCIFAYGQTGSGKTYTMMGRPEAPDHKGLIPRSLEQIFQTSQSLASQGWRYTMQASMLEIYNETIRDLLSNRSSFDMTSTESGVAGKQCEIKHDANKNPYVPGLTIIDVCSIKEISSLLQQAAKSRSVGKTNMNEHSSRSHFVFTLRISGINESTDQRVHGVLNLIDLAGSERLSKSGATGDRQKETVAINSSLSALGDVIFSLSKKEGHVPFRNSKLTHLLQPYLGGDSKALMVVNVSPDPSSVGESLCSLRFAARVNACEVGIPRRQTSMQFSDNRLSCG